MGHIYCRMESDLAQDEYGNINQCSIFLDVSESKFTEQDLKRTVLALTKSNTELERLHMWHHMICATFT